MTVRLSGASIRNMCMIHIIDTCALTCIHTVGPTRTLFGPVLSVRTEWLRPSLQVPASTHNAKSKVHKVIVRLFNLQKDIEKTSYQHFQGSIRTDCRSTVKHMNSHSSFVIVFGVCFLGLRVHGNLFYFYITKTVLQFFELQSFQNHTNENIHTFNINNY